jgi:hypothetical protein
MCILIRYQLHLGYILHIVLLQAHWLLTRLAIFSRVFIVNLTIHINIYTGIFIVNNCTIIQYASVISCSYQQMIWRLKKYQNEYILTMVFNSFTVTLFRSLSGAKVLWDRVPHVGRFCNNFLSVRLKQTSNIIVILWNGMHIF